MTMKIDDSLRWQTECEAEMEISLRALFPDEPGTVSHVLASYRQGWNDCFHAARMHGVAKLD